MNSNPSSSAARAQKDLGRRLRELRKDAGLTARVLAESTGQHYTRVSKIENGVQPPSDHDVREWCRACRVPEQTADLIATLRALESAYLEFRRQSRSGMKRVLGAHTRERYRRTKRFRIYEHNVLPGLFQTADYAAAMLSFWIRFLDVPNDLDEAVAIRMQRQDVVRDPSKRFSVLLEEQALRTWFGTAATQAAALRHLLEVMAQPNVAVGVIPMMVERSAVGSTGFWLFDDALAALETPTASIEVNRPDEIALYARMFGVLGRPAVHGQAAHTLVSAVLDELAG